MVENARYPKGSELRSYVPNLDTAELVQMGGQKAVYKASLDGHIYALKMIALDIQEEWEDGEEGESLDVSEIISRAKREVTILGDADVPVLTKRGPLGLTLVPIDGQLWLYFTEEWIEGTSLRDLLKSERLTPARAARLGVDIVQATCWLAKRNFVHRDIKPANVMWSVDRSRFVLLDHGIALDLHGTSLTRSPLIVGTAAYLSPEQMDPTRKRGLDFRSDLFAIGILLYESAVGQHPFRPPGSSQKDVLGNILTINPQPAAEMFDDFPRPLSDFITRLLGKKPHMRFRSCDRALEEIETIANKLEDEV